MYVKILSKVFHLAEPNVSLTRMSDNYKMTDNSNLNKKNKKKLLT